MPQLLIETNAPSMFSMVEARQAPGSGKMVARGEFGRVGVATANGRIYPERLMEREIKRLGEDLKGRRVLGELDHPADGKTSLKRVSHVITDIWVEKDGRVMGEAEILNTTMGKELKALIEAKIPVGVSSRGFGSTKASGTAEGEEVQDDFVLRTYDFVADPAVKTAIPGITMESVDSPTAAQLFLAEFPEVAAQLSEAAVKDAVERAKGKAVAGVDEAVAAAEARVRSELTEAFERRLAQSLIEAREDLTSELREEFSLDPAVGAAKATLAMIAEAVAAYRAVPEERVVKDALRAKDEAAVAAIKRADETKAKCEELEVQLHVARKVAGHAAGATLVSLMEDTGARTIEAADKKLSALMESMPEAMELTEAQVQLREENATLRATQAALQEKVEGLDGRLRRAVEMAQEVESRRSIAEDHAAELEEQLAAVQAQVKADQAEIARAQAQAKLATYKADKVAGMANARALLGLMEDVTSEAGVDNVVEKHGKMEVADGDLRAMRERLRRGAGEPKELEEGRHRSRADSPDDIDMDAAWQIATGR